MGGVENMDAGKSTDTIVRDAEGDARDVFEIGLVLIIYPQIVLISLCAIIQYTMYMAKRGCHSRHRAKIIISLETIFIILSLTSVYFFKRSDPSGLTHSLQGLRSTLVAARVYTITLSCIASCRLTAFTYQQTPGISVIEKMLLLMKYSAHSLAYYLFLATVPCLLPIRIVDLSFGWEMWRFNSTEVTSIVAAVYLFWVAIFSQLVSLLVSVSYFAYQFAKHPSSLKTFFSRPQAPLPIHLQVHTMFQYGGIFAWFVMHTLSVAKILISHWFSGKEGLASEVGSRLVLAFFMWAVLRTAADVFSIIVDETTRLMSRKPYKKRTTPCKKVRFHDEEWYESTLKMASRLTCHLPPPGRLLPTTPQVATHHPTGSYP